MINGANIFTSSEHQDNDLAKRSLVQDFLFQQKPVESKLDPVDLAFNKYSEGLENQDINKLVNMYKRKTEILCGHDLNTHNKHSEAIDKVLLIRLNELVKNQVSLTLEQENILEELS